MKRIALAGAALALAVPGLATAADQTPSPREAAKAACKAERAGMGKATWKATWRAAGLGRCITGRTAAEKQNQSNAAKECKAERADETFAATHEDKTFAEFYGTNKNGKNAYGKCVSTKAKAASREDTEARVNAAKACKAEKKGDAAKFAADYGTKKNAFGKCVSKKAQAQNDEA